jgi:sulfate/thiosulfate transport system ATP-binding protein
VHVTTIFVTHDQEEAMAVADQIAVVNRGRIEQVGGPRELYERPATEFVMSFVGPATKLDGRWVRPHDLDLRPEPSDGSLEAMVRRIVHLGFEVRIELETGEGEPLWAQLTRDEVEQLEVEPGQIVYVLPGGARVPA